MGLRLVLVLVLELGLVLGLAHHGESLADRSGPLALIVAEALRGADGGDGPDGGQMHAGGEMGGRWWERTDLR